ncbi:MAG: carboxypeptidase regulatory-like domain-containing protein [Alphaproteobacteria bacterium]|nr:carboxypeptidase regulatory-like domain-containing protein [Alphaproteobacteria bacterium]
MRRLLLVAAGLGVGTACCPIPVPRRVSVRPRIEVTVTDADGRAVSGATLTLARWIEGPPPDTEVDRWSATTDPAGQHVFDAIEATESAMPLMMHGVPWYGWRLCAEAPGLGAGTWELGATQPVMGPTTAGVTLVPGASCSAGRVSPSP